jgi:zinc/manganese transport system permease protein
MARSVTVLRVIIAGVLVIPGIWLCALPRADQPLLDMVERVIPEVRALYLTAQERAIHDEAAVYAERYRRQAEQLNEREAVSRWQGAALSDNEVRRISSFLKSYNEMRKGEAFVQREVRGRARARNRWVLGLGLVLGGMLIAPWRLWRGRGQAKTN